MKNEIRTYVANITVKHKFEITTEEIAFNLGIDINDVDEQVWEDFIEEYIIDNWEECVTNAKKLKKFNYKRRY